MLRSREAREERLIAEDVLYWVAQGKTNVETAKILNIAPGTVKSHLEGIYEKLV